MTTSLDAIGNFGSFCSCLKNFFVLYEVSSLCFYATKLTSDYTCMRSIMFGTKHVRLDLWLYESYCSRVLCFEFQRLSVIDVLFEDKCVRQHWKALSVRCFLCFTEKSIYC